MKWSLAAAGVLGFVVAGCASALGGSKPEARDAIAMRVPADMTAEQLGGRIQQGGYEYAILSAPRDSAWLASAAARAGLQMTRPGRVGNTSYVFFGPKAIGDTLHVIRVSSGGTIRLHDALFKIDKNRNLDLILARFDSIANIQDGVRHLLAYVAKDVSGNAALLLAIDAPQQLTDSVAFLVRAAYTDTRECAGGATGGQSSIRLLYGPLARIRCERAAVLNEPGTPVSGNFLLFEF